MKTFLEFYKLRETDDPDAIPDKGAYPPGDRTETPLWLAAYPPPAAAEKIRKTASHLVDRSAPADWAEQVAKYIWDEWPENCLAANRQ